MLSPIAAHLHNLLEGRLVDAVEGGVAVAFRREIAEADDPEAKRQELEERFAAGRSPFPRSESFGVHDLIDPRETRPRLCRWAELSRQVLEDKFRDRGR